MVVIDRLAQLEMSKKAIIDLESGNEIVSLAYIDH
jgi:hypothetical protein